MLVEALEPCFINGHRRRPGEGHSAVFEYKEGGQLPSYLKVVGADAIDVVYDEQPGDVLIDEHLPPIIPTIPDIKPAKLKKPVMRVKR